MLWEGRTGVERLPEEMLQVGSEPEPLGLSAPQYMQVLEEASRRDALWRVWIGLRRTGLDEERTSPGGTHHTKVNG